jgi:hypothetical protein
MKISSPKAINWTLKQYGYTAVCREAIGLLLDFAGAWWVGWCLSQHKLSLFQSMAAAVHHTRDAQCVTRPGFLCINKYFIKAFLGVFEKKIWCKCVKII